MPKKKPVKQTKKRIQPQKYNYEQIKSDAVAYLALNPGKTFQDFCKEKKEKYDYLRQKIDITWLYRESALLQQKKNEEKLKTVEKELIKEGKKEALNYINEIRQNKSFIGLIVNKIIKKDNSGVQRLTQGFNSAGEALRCINEFNKTNILLDEKLRENEPLTVDGEKQEAKNKLDARISELIEFKKTNDTTQNIINTNVDNKTATD